MEHERILRSSVWIGDGEEINIEIIWEKLPCQSGEATLKGAARLTMTQDEATSLHDKLHHALMSSLRSAPRPAPGERLLATSGSPPNPPIAPNPTLGSSVSP
jgi:hypothetical protein